MSELSDLLWKSNQKYLKNFFDEMCDAYENDKTATIKKFYEDGVLKGFCMIKDIDGVRILSEAHYLGDNKYTALKMWKFMIKGASKVRASVFKNNHCMIDFLKRLKFDIVDEVSTNFIMERAI